MKKFIIPFFVLLSLGVSAQDIKRGYKNLEKNEYDKAKDDFAKNLANDESSVGANFGMAMVLSNDELPLFDIIDSWQYAEKIDGNLNNLSQEEIEIIGEYFRNTRIDPSSRPVKKKMQNSLDAIEARFIKYVREENNLDAVYEVMERYPDFKYYDNVVHIRNQFEYRKYEKQNTLAGYLEFIQKFPDAAQKQKAERQISMLAFNEVKTQNSVSAYTTYINTYPDSEYLQSAIKLRNAAAFSEAKSINTLEAYETFIEQYPEALEIAEARTYQHNLLYEKAKRIKSLQAFNEFIGMYPDGQYFVDIFNLKASELGNQFLLENSFSNPSIAWAKGLDNNGRVEEGGSAAITPEGDYIIACNTRDTDTAYADAWIVKLDSEGSMIWNKTIGQPFEDSVKSVMLDSKGNIYIVGYTHMTADSLSKMGWMFKLGSDGSKIWNKTLGRIDIASCLIDKTDRIIIGSSEAKDSLGNHYAISIFNSDARKVAERTYTGRGRINDLLVNDKNDLLLCGSNWICLIDQRRYMLWDDEIPADLTATHVAGNSITGYYAVGVNESNIFYARYEADGKKAWLQNYDKSDPSQVINAVDNVLQGNILVLESKSDGVKMKTFASDGKVVSVKELHGNTVASNIYSKNQDTLLLLNGNDLVVIKLTNLVSL